MVKHYVMWKFLEEAEGKTKDENLDYVKGLLFALKDELKIIKKMEFKKNQLTSDMHYDALLYIEFDSFEDLAAYQVYPAHKAISEYVKKCRSGRSVVDFEE